MKRVIISCVGLEQYRGIVREEIQASIDRGEIRNYFYGGAPSSFDDFLAVFHSHLSWRNGTPGVFLPSTFRGRVLSGEEDGKRG